MKTLGPWSWWPWEGVQCPHWYGPVSPCFQDKSKMCVLFCPTRRQHALLPRGLGNYRLHPCFYISGNCLAGTPVWVLLGLLQTKLCSLLPWAWQAPWDHSWDPAIWLPSEFWPGVQLRISASQLPILGALRVQSFQLSPRAHCLKEKSRECRPRHLRTPHAPCTLM